MISLVIVNYNQGRYLGKAIASILEQTRQDWELLIWDDGSTDNSVAIARKYQQQDERIRVIAATHQGFTKGLKNAIAKTTGDYIGWVDSDDWIANTAVEETAKVLDRNAAIGMVYTDYYDVNSRGKILGTGKRCNIPYSPQRLLVDFMTFHFRLFRREVYEQTGGINTNLKYAQDYDLCLRLSEITDFARVKKPLYYYRHHRQSISYTKRKEQTQCSEQLINQALQRRGLADNYILQVEGDCFYLRKKERGTRNEEKTTTLSPSSLSPHLPCLPVALSKLFKTAITVLPFTAALSLQPASAQQIIPNNDGTMTVITQDGSTFNIDGGTLSGDGKNLFHSFREFGLDAGQIANFLSNPNIQNILGRINGGNASIINGLIQVSGGNSNLFLMNPSGIIFGNNASLNVPGDFTATTATGIGFGSGWFNAVGANDYLNLVGNPNSLNFANSESGVIINAGDLTVKGDSNISLTGGTVINTGTIKTEGGNITIAAVPGTNRVRISQRGQLLSIEVVVPQDVNGQPLAIRAMDLPTLLRGLPVDTGLAVAANDNDNVTVENSNTVIPNEPGTTIVSGKIDVSNNEGVGGEAHLLGNKVGLIGANVDASGDAGGGKVLVGGEYKGQGTLPTAQVTVVDSDSTIQADALQTGDGGEVIVWSDSTTRVYGNISAKGGANSGDGGFVETSSAGFLDIQTTPDISALNGFGGTWLIDPRNIRITNLDQVDPDIGTVNPFIAEGDDVDDVNLWVGFIEDALTGGVNVRVSTGTEGNQEGNITLETDLDFDGTGTNSLSLEAANNIIIGDGYGAGQIFDSVPSTSDTLNLTLTANNDINVNANIITRGGNITLTGNADDIDGGVVNITSATLDSTGGDINIFGKSSSNAQNNAFGINLQGATLNSEDGNIELKGTAGGNSNVNGGTNTGVRIQPATKVESTGAGAITIVGTGGIGIDNNRGISVTGENTEIKSVDGTISLTGTANNNTTGFSNSGIDIRGGANIESTGTGNITLEGTGGAGTNNNIGIFLFGTSAGNLTEIKSVGGSISLTGRENPTNNTTGERNGGINIEGTVRVSSENGNINLTGTGGSGTGGLHRGININSGAVVESTGNGNLTLVGTGGSGGGTATPNEGILIQDDNSVVRSVDGNIDLQGNATGSNNPGIGIDADGSVQSTGTANVSLRGTNADADGIRVSSGSIQGSNSAVVLTGDEIDLSNTSTSITGDTVTIQPETLGSPITLGNGTSGLDITQTELNNITANSLTIGRTDGTGTITVDSNLELAQDTEFITGGTFSAQDQDITGNESNISIEAASITTGDIDTNGLNQSGSGYGSFPGGDGGEVELTATTGSIITGNITTAGGSGSDAYSYSIDPVSGENGGDGGKITITSTSGQITTQSIVSSGGTGGEGVNGGSNGIDGSKGDVGLSAPQGVTSTYIDAGNINIDGNGAENNTDGLFIATNTIPETNTSIRGTDNVIIEHGGGNNGTPFEVSNPSTTNGTAGNIVSSTETVADATFRDSFRSEEGTIQILTNIPIVAADDGTGSVVTVQDDGVTFDLTGGTLSGDRQNLFHSYTRFDLPQSDQTANFIVNNSIENILARVTSGDASDIRGRIQVTTEGNPNLFLLNPAGIIFGETAQLDVPAAFTATTGNGVRFGDNWFSASGDDATVPNGTPEAIALTMDRPGAIINNANLTNSNGALNLIGGQVSIQGNINANGFSGVGLKEGASIVNLSDFSVISTEGISNLPNPFTGRILTVTELAQLIDPDSSFTFASGIALSNGNQINTNGQDINLIGSTNDDGVGVSIFGGAIVNSEGGNITLTGTSLEDAGVVIDESTINANGGNITITGTSDTEDGVFIRGQITTADAGNMNITGTSSAENGIITLGTEGTEGSPTTITTVNGETNLTGTSTDGLGVNTQITNISSTNGAITITGTSTDNDGMLIDNTNISTNSNVTLTADEIDLINNTTLRGDTVTLQPETPELDITVASDTQSDDVLDITEAELKTIQTDTNSVVIGREDGFGTISVLGEINNSNLNSNLTLRTPATNGAILVNEAITTNNNNVNLDGAVSLNQDTNITSNGTGDINFTSTVDGTSNLTLNSGTGNINFEGAIGSQTAVGNIQANSSGITRFNSTVNATNVVTNAEGTTQLNGNVTTTRDQTYNDAVELENNTTVIGNDITFNSTVRSVVDENNALIVNARDITPSETTETDIGEITFNGAVGDNNQALSNLETDSQTGTTNLNGGSVTTTGDQTYNNGVVLGSDTILQGANVTANAIDGANNLTVNASGNTRFNGAAGADTPLSSLTTDEEGTTQLNGNVTTTGDQTYRDAVELENNTTVTGNDITFNSTVRSVVDENNALTVNARDIPPNETTETDIGEITFNGAVGDNNQALSNLETDSQTGTTNLNGGSVTTTEDQTYENTVTLGSNTTSLTSENSNITLNQVDFNGVGDNGELNVQAGDDINLDGKIVDSNGNDDNLNLDLTADINNNSGRTINISESIDTNDGDITLRANEVNIEEGVTVSGNNVTLQPQNPGTDIFIAPNAESENNFDVTQSELDAIQANAITIGDEINTDTITVANPVTVDDPITLRTPNTIQLDGDITAIENGSVVLDSSQTNFNSNITTQGDDITIDSDLTLQDDIALNTSSEEGTGGNINLQGNVNGSNNLTLDAGSGNINLQGNVGNETPLNTLNARGTIQTAGRDLNVTAHSISTQDITTEGGNVGLRSTSGAISTENINSSGTTGGNVTLNSASTIATRAINSRGTSGAGGNVTLNSGDDSNIRVATIRADGNSNNGGTVQVNAESENPGLFVANSSFPLNGEPTSIFTTNSTEAAIVIKHGGGVVTPFEVGNPEFEGQDNVNGTVGAIIAGGGDSQIDDGSFRFTTRQGNIEIISAADDGVRDQIGTQIDTVLNRSEPDTAQVINSDSDQALVESPLMIASIPEARETLQNIAREAAQKPALVYVNFTSSQIPTAADNSEEYFRRAENCLTEEFKQALNLQGTQTAPIICLAAQPTDQLEVLVVTPEGEPIYFKSDVTREEVEEQAEELYLEVSDNEIGWREPSQQLYEWLIGDIEEELATREIDNLLFVLPPKLRSLPIAALYDGRNREFLVQKGYNVGLAPSINLMNTIYAKEIQDAEVLALGASDFTEEQQQIPLNAVEVELNEIIALRGGNDPILNEQFTLPNLKNTLDKNSLSIVHLATHANFDADNIDNIYIQLYDQKLTLDQVKALNIKVGDTERELLVLSACRSAFGNLDAELGFAGLAIKLGFKTAIGSLWYVEDVTNPGLMAEFYHQLKTNPFKAEALRLAQVAMIEGNMKIDLEARQITTSWGETIELPEEAVAALTDQGIDRLNLSHPYYWAPFTVIGSPW